MKGINKTSASLDNALEICFFQGLMKTIATNTVGPLIMAKYFSPLLLKGNGEFGVPGNKTNHTAILVNISAKVGKNKFQVRYLWIFVTVIGTGQHRVQDT
jgi:NAD(P)-dependent dehydrogenase (short-subunit alcohol dehydrogenase family)